MIQLKQPGKNINDDIAALVKEGLKPTVQQAADIVRIKGNAAVHPGEIETDDADTVMKLFELVNLIAEDLITIPNRMESLFKSEVPEDKREAIAERDAQDT
jgi:hypothetical protein